MVLAVVRTFYYVATTSETQKIVSPLVRLLHVSSEIERVVLPYLLMVSRTLSVSKIHRYFCYIDDLLCAVASVGELVLSLPCANR